MGLRSEQYTIFILKVLGGLFSRTPYSPGLTDSEFCDTMGV